MGNVNTQEVIACGADSRGSRGQRRASGSAFMGPCREEVARNKAGSSFIFDGGGPQPLPWTGSSEDWGPFRKVVSPSSGCHPSL